MFQGKEMGQFAASNKNREQAGKEIAPLIQKIEAEFAVVLEETRVVKQKAGELMRLQGERAALERQVRQLKREMHQTKTHLAAVKAESELGFARQSAAYTALRDEVQSLERTVARRDDYFQSYERRLSNVAEAAGKQQAQVGDRLLVFEQRLRQLSRDTVEAARQAKQDSTDTMADMMAMKDQLARRLVQTEEKERILDLYMAERHETPRKFKDIHDHLAACLKQNDFHDFKNSHERALQDTLAKTKVLIQQMVPPHTQQTLKALETRIAAVEGLKAQLGGIEEVRARVEAFEAKLENVERKEDHRINTFREEAVEMEEKIIEVIDRKIQSVEEEIEHIQVKQEDSIDDKLQKMKEQLLSLIQNQQRQQVPPITTSLEKTVTLPVLQQSVGLEEELITIRRERELAEKQGAEIRQLGQGLNHKLSLFSNRITMCRSDIEIFMENTGKQIKKIADVRREEEDHMGQVGRVLADLTEAIIVLTSLTLADHPRPDPKSFATFHDGIVLELNKSAPGIINYRRLLCSCNDLKESLLLALLNQIDTTSTQNGVLRWDQYRPSAFFSKIKEHLTVKQKQALRSPSAHARSPRKKKDEEDLLFDLKMESEQLFKGTHQRPKIIINNSTLLLTSEKPKSEMGMRYKLKRQEEMGKKQQERSSFSKSRSHRRGKIVLK